MTTPPDPQTVSPPTLSIEVTAHPPLVQARTHLWHAWARNAIEHEREALATRAEMIAAAAARQNVSELIYRETRSSLIAVTSAAFAVDALHNEIAGEVGRHQSNIGKYRAATFGVAAPSADLADDLHWLNDERNAAVHYVGEQLPLVRHPGLETNVAVDSARWVCAAATKATSIFFRVAAAVIDGEHVAELERWASWHREGLEYLRTCRTVGA